MVIQWSDEDDTYIVSLPERSDLVHTHGDSYEEAVRSGETMLIESAQVRGQSLPPPNAYMA